MRFTPLVRFAVSSVASVSMLIGSMVSAPRVALAGDENDPWFQEATASAVNSVSSPIELGREFKPTDPNRIVFDARAFPIGTSVRIRHLGFRPHQRFVEWTFKFVPRCPNNRCWQREYVDTYVADASGSFTFNWGTNRAAVGHYRFCTGGIEGCQWRYANLELTAQAPDTLVPIYTGTFTTSSP